MRIAFSGSHRVGKSTLLEAVGSTLTGYTTVDEPYHLLEEEGYETSDDLSLDDFEAQLERSLVALEEDDEANVLFDRCPVDVLAYLLTHVDADGFDLDDSLDRVRAAMQTIDLIVYVPIEEPDRIARRSNDDEDLRQTVNDKVHELLIDDALDLDANVVTVRGSVGKRVGQVLGQIR